jgi:hypothetical protein
MPGGGPEGRCILAVEDDWFLAVALHRALQAAGAVVGPVPTAST